MLRKILPLLVLIAIVAALIVWRGPVIAWGRATWDRLTGAAETDSAATGPLIASGFIEAPAIDVAPAASGRILKLHVTDGQAVQAGDPVAELDRSVLEAQITAAAAAVKVAEAQAQQARAGPRQADSDVGRAAVDQARVAWVVADEAAADAAALVDAPAVLDVDIARAETALQVATAQMDAATAAATAADLEEQLWGRIVPRLEAGVDVTLPPQLGGGTRRVDAPPDKLAEARLQWNLSSQAAWEAHAQQATAVAARSAAGQSLADLRAEKADPVALKGQAAAAQAAAGVAESAYDVAEANLRVLHATGTSLEQMAVADAAVARARAAQVALEARRPQYTVLAPRSGKVSEVILHEGEVVASGAPIAQLRTAGDVTLTAYVPEARIAEVQPGGPAAVALAAFPGRTFPGVVTHIAGEAEFTPKNVQTRAERATTVFAVKLSLPNADDALKAGMLADAFFCPSSDPCAFPSEALTVEQAAAPSSGPYAGSLEAVRVAVAAEAGGRVVEVNAAEGDAVKAGQVLITIDGEELAAQAAEADVAIAAAQAELARIEAQPQPQRVAQAAANVKQAEAALTAAEARRDAAEAVYRNQQALDAQINSARQAITTAGAAVDAARAQVKSAQVLQESLPTPGSDEDKTRRAAYDAGVQAANARLRAAQAQQSGARKVLAALIALHDNPVTLAAAFHRAVGEVEIAVQAVEVARAAAAQVSAPPPAEAVAVGRARIAQAEAGRAAIDAALAKLHVGSPLAGEVTVQAIHAGEVATAGATLFTVADLARLKLTVYVPLSELAAVHVGQPAQVTVDGLPGRTFTGVVAKIADQAEYTPKNVQTAEERARMVVRVELTLDNPDGLLRPGIGAVARW